MARKEPTKRQDQYDVPMTHAEVWVILRALATANSAAERDQNKQDSTARTWIADRLLRMVEEKESRP